MKYIHFALLLLGLILVASCGSKKKVSRNKNSTKTERVSDRNNNTPAEVNSSRPAPVKRYADVVEEYINEYSHIAKEEMKQYKIPASITLAQGILESGAGRGELSRRANNHFGIKCHDWEGDKVYHDDDRSQECFRKYNDAKYSYRDHSLFLSERRRYAFLFDYDIDDYERWAKGLREAGYATDRKYPDKLIDLIERYELYKFDSEVLGKKTRQRNVSTYNRADGYIVQKGDTLYSIAKRYNTTVEFLQKENNLNGSNISIGQELIIPAAPNNN